MTYIYIGVTNPAYLAHEIEFWEIINYNYHVTSNLESTLDAWGEGTRQCNPQRHTSDSREEEFIVHEDVVGEDCVVSFGHQCFNQLWQERIPIKVLNKSFMHK